MDLNFSYLKERDIHFIKVRGRLDSYHASQLENFLKPVLRRAKKIILECSEVTFDVTQLVSQLKEKGFSVDEREFTPA